jgi:trehalose-phosphatase
VTPEGEEKLGAFFGTWPVGANPVLMVDYDGTLAGFRVNRFLARPWAGVREVLTRIQAQGRTRLVVITGRPAGEIAPLLGLPEPVEVWGLHDAERLSPDGRRELELAPAATQARLEEVKEQLRRDALGGLFEDKANGAVMHWRGLALRQKALVEKRTRALFEPLAKLDGLALLEFEAGLELRAGRDKGGAVKAILAEMRAAGKTPGPVAYLGDDLTDEEAFKAVNALDETHLSVLVRSKWRETAAVVWVRPPGEVLGFLERWGKAGDRV